ncbi:MAG: thiosulfate oxidation carrier protein SoxY [Pseudomonadota bacterium]|nr:thiosulfate oxidation carrier protein SoxY [Pseudomonadota bacterium]
MSVQTKTSQAVLAEARRQSLRQSARLAALLCAAGFAQFAELAQAAVNKPAFDSRSVAEAVKAMGGGALAASSDVSLSAPDIAENGAVVRLTVASNLPGVKQLLVLVEKNPFALVAAFQVTEFIEPQFTFNIKMNETSDVYVVALLTNGRAMFTKREVRVTLGGCG